MLRNQNIDGLTKLPNIGKVLAQQLMEIGIDTPEKLDRAGSEKTFIMLKSLDPDACFCKLCAIEGAIKRIRWHDLSVSEMEALKVFFHMVNKA